MNPLFSKILHYTGVNQLETLSDKYTVKSNKKRDLEKEMLSAWKNGSFEIYYQPQVDTEGVILSAEALLRWNHPKLGFISPEEFIPIAEETQIINQMTDWIIKQACSQLKEWKDRGLSTQSITINISPVRLMKNSLVKYVKKQLEIYSISPTYLEFEIKESSLMKCDKVVVTNLEGLKELGIRIVIDDFGMGHSSIENLMKFQADTLKIDRLFIKDMKQFNGKNGIIVSSIISLAKSLDMKIIAEGVEEYEQFKFLKDSGCDYIQGHLFSKPVPLEEYEKLLSVGYIKTDQISGKSTPRIERRKYYRFEFASSVVGEMTVAEVNNKKVNLGTTDILIKDISLGGIKVQSKLKLPMNADIKYKFMFTIMDEQFDLEGKLRWKKEADKNTFYYGLEFYLLPGEEDRLAPIINKMTAIRSLNEVIPDTEFIDEDSNFFLTNQSQ